MCRWTPKGSINGEILLEIMNTLDILKVFDAERAHGIKPMLLLDAHGSRFHLKLLGYINSPVTE